MTSTILVQSFSRAYVASLTGIILHFFSLFRGSNIGNSCICHFIFIFPGYNTNKFNDQLPVTWLTDANWLEPCLGIAVRVNPRKPTIFSGFFFSQLHKLRLLLCICYIYATGLRSTPSSTGRGVIFYEHGSSVKI